MLARSRHGRGGVQMAQESPLVVVPKEHVQAILPPAMQMPLPEEQLPPATPEQVKAVETVFAQDQESEAVYGLLGMWTGTLLLHDLAKETFDKSAEEEEEEAGEEPDPEDRSHP